MAILYPVRKACSACGRPMKTVPDETVEGRLWYVCTTCDDDPLTVRCGRRSSRSFAPDVASAHRNEVGGIQLVRQAWRKCLAGVAPPQAPQKSPVGLRSLTCRHLADFFLPA
ncbi:hypothetical protein ABIC09_001265 [Bradyrhizobium sp. S3.12.5]